MSWLYSNLAQVCWGGVLAGLIVVNGQRCANPLFQLYRGDVISLTQLGGATGSCVWHLRQPGAWRPSLAPKGATSAVLWTDIPAYLETDEMTASIAVLAEPRWLSSDVYVQTPFLPFTTLKCYN